MDELERYVRARNQIRYCDKCKSRMAYTAVHGTYTCPECGNTFKDTYGKMKDLLAEDPSLTKGQLASIIGVPLRQINQYIRNGVLENPAGDQSV